MGMCSLSTGSLIITKKYTCVRLGTNTWQFTYYDEILAACGTALDLELDKKYRTQQDIQRLLRY